MEIFIDKSEVSGKEILRKIGVERLQDRVRILLLRPDGIIPAMHYFETNVSERSLPIEIETVDKLPFSDDKQKTTTFDDVGFGAYRNYNFVVLDSSQGHPFNDVLLGYIALLNKMPRHERKRVKIVEGTYYELRSLMRSVEMKVQRGRGTTHYVTQQHPDSHGPSAVYLNSDYVVRGLSHMVGFNGRLPRANLEQRIVLQ
ncbi:MAG TPA: hypothetical protein VJJ52_01620 [Candidatus Nanoarchaeia archaeon]|nr:hypothetical protein [Candidatus Nanoarchaeia archaeon]